MSHATLTQAIIDEIKRSGHLPWRRPWASAAPRNAVSGRPYRGANRLRLSLAPYSSPLWLTYNQARRLGGNVRKGERGTPVQLWRFDEAEEDGEKASHRAPMVRMFTLFNSLQCEKLGMEQQPGPSIEPCVRAQMIAESYEGAPKIKVGWDAAYYSPAEDTVVVPPINSFERVGAYWATLFHELAHSTGHRTRLARPEVVDIQGFGSAPYAREELVAELASAFLVSDAGLTVDMPNSAAYLAGWVNALEADSALLPRSAAHAQTAVDWIVGVRGGIDG